MRSVVMAVILGIVCLGQTSLAAATPARVDPTAIRLVDQDGRTFTLRDLRGRPVLLTFVATRCTDACPIANAVFAGLQRDFAHERLDARLMTVTLDPQHDTPFVVANTARMIGADPSRWRFASGTIPDVQRFLRAFNVVVQPNAQGIPDVHSTFIFLLDRNGHVSRTMLLSTTVRQEVLAALTSHPASPGR